MKKPILLILFAIVSTTVFCQTYPIDLEAVALTNFDKNVKKDQSIHFTSIRYENCAYFGTDVNIDNVVKGYLLADGLQLEINQNLSDKIDIKCKNIQDVWDESIIKYVVPYFRKNGYSSSLRYELESDALQYLSLLEENYLEFNDPYLKFYLYQLVAKLTPERQIDGRPGNISIFIKQDPTLNACTLPNGTIVINTGLLSALHSEEEIVAVLAHEIAHNMVDHSVQNVLAYLQRKERSEFWAKLATAITAMTEGVAAGYSGYYTGYATYNMAVLSSQIGHEIEKQLGIVYSHKQEKEADDIAIKMLETLGYSKSALSSALSRIADYLLVERSNSVFYSSDTHPALMERIKSIGTVNKTRDIGYERIMSAAITNSALLKYDDRRYRQALEMVTQNIDNEVGNSDDYILRAYCLLALHDDDNHNAEALQMIKCARKIAPTDINIFSPEILANIRIGNVEEAQKDIDSYMEELNRVRKEIIDANHPYYNVSISTVEKEFKWAKDMKIRLQVL